MKTLRFLGLFMILTLMISLFPASKVQAATLCVNPGGTGGCYAAIQAAIDAAAAGDTIMIDAGAYTNAAILVNKALTIQGAGPGDTIITPTSPPALIVSANDVVISGLTITHPTQLTEGIRVSSTSNLTIDRVDFSNLGIAPASNAFGINILNSFTNLTVRRSNFLGKGLNIYDRVIGIFLPKKYFIRDFLIEDNVFSKVFVGVYFGADIDGLMIRRNIFGPMELQDCTAAASGVYIGDGSINFDIKNVTVDSNTFTSYCRGFYLYTYVPGEVVGRIDITNNAFLDSIYSSAIRFIGILNSVQLAALDGPINIQSNTFYQSVDVGGTGGVGLIDMRVGLETPTSLFDISENSFTFNGPFTAATYGVLFRGPVTQAIVNANDFNGNHAGGTIGGPPTSGILVLTNSPFGPLTSNTKIEINENSITNFTNGVALYDFASSVYGGLPTGASVLIERNAITGNSNGIVSGEGEYASARYNWWGNASGPAPSGGGDSASGNVTFTPWLCEGVDTSESIGFQALVKTDCQAPIVSGISAVANPAPINSSVSVTALVDDTSTGNTNITQAVFSLDGISWSSMVAQDGAYDSPTEVVTTSVNAPIVPGIYDLCIHGTDAAANTSADECILLVVYDPAGGFVTGGGWIWSPAGAYTADTSLEGKATFGFVAKYKKGATLPDGNTEFQFKAGGLNFQSNSYNWLIVAGKKAQFKGVGTINGAGVFKFMIFAGDDTPDTFRIQIWDADDNPVYDNGSQQPLGGGSVVIHK